MLTIMRMRACVGVVLSFFCACVLRCPGARPLACHVLGAQCPEIHSSYGTVAPGWERVLSAHSALIRNGYDAGSQFVLYHKGKVVVDIVGGTGVPWPGSDSGAEEPQELTREDWVPVFSSGKVAESLVVAVLADRGYLRLDERISTYWPAFGQKGKVNITVQQLMRHQGGLLVPPEPIDLALLAPGREDDLSALLAAQELNWEPENHGAEWPRQVYHAVSRGLYLAEVVRRVDPKGRTTGQFFADEIAGPLNINVTFAGRSQAALDGGATKLVESSPKLIAKLIPQYVLPEWVSKSLVGDLDTLFEYETSRAAFLFGEAVRERWLPMQLRGITSVISGTSSMRAAQRRDMLLAESLTSANAIGNARGLARIAAALAARGEHDGVRVLSEKGYEAAAAPGPASRDEVLGINVSYCACGWGRDRFLRHGYGGFIGWAGASGSVVQWNPSQQLAFAYVPTLAYPRVARPRALRLLRAITDSLEAVEAGTVRSRMPRATAETLEIEERWKRQREGVIQEGRRFREEMMKLKAGARKDRPEEA
eukprot:TRINITY_DN40514_c0_g1_i1.p1 TRINITY_DN40514_c0_g1~~TRINITY_DN40514_c0_g1_i1.p1  ORF type:complete len:538 (+),score=162.11 TRINITY_DN40514_c0_g1_i1:62-1675(+)